MPSDMCVYFYICKCICVKYDVKHPQIPSSSGHLSLRLSLVAATHSTKPNAVRVWVRVCPLYFTTIPSFRLVDILQLPVPDSLDPSPCLAPHPASSHPSLLPALPSVCVSCIPSPGPSLSLSVLHPLSRPFPPSKSPATPPTGPHPSSHPALFLSGSSSSSIPFKRILCPLISPAHAPAGHFKDLLPLPSH